MLADIDDQSGAGRLAALARARSARQHGNLQLTRDLDRSRNVVFRGGDEHPQRKNLIDRGVGGISPTRSAVEQNGAARFCAQTAFEDSSRLRSGHAESRIRSRAGSRAPSERNALLV